MIHDEEDNIISTDMYVKQQNYNDVTPVEDVECHITSYDQPVIMGREGQGYNRGPWDDNAHIVFDVPKLEPRY